MMSRLYHEINRDAVGQATTAIPLSRRARVSRLHDDPNPNDLLPGFVGCGVIETL
jgi:hypothetical protein